MDSTRLNNSVSIFAQKKNRGETACVRGSGRVGVCGSHDEPKSYKLTTPVSLYTRKVSKSHVVSQNHACIDNNTRRSGSKVAKTTSHEVDDYIGAEERADMVLEVLRRNGLSDGFVAYTDGSCWNSDPNRSGGAAYVVLDNHGRVCRSAHKGFRGTSNNRMEMLAIISAVASIPKGSSIVVLTDSQYSIRAFTYGGSKNQDLIELFDKCGMDRDVSH